MKASTKIMFGCFGLFAVALYAGGSKPADRCKDEFWAYMASTRFVTERLLSPTSADFPRSQAPGVIITQPRPCLFEIRSYVDAQNAFGATIRARYIAVIEPIGEDRWRPHSVEILDPI